jgi:hypothetical protein
VAEFARNFHLKTIKVNNVELGKRVSVDAGFEH